MKTQRHSQFVHAVRATGRLATCRGDRPAHPCGLRAHPEGIVRYAFSERYGAFLLVRVTLGHKEECPRGSLLQFYALGGGNPNKSCSSRYADGEFHRTAKMAAGSPDVVPQQESPCIGFEWDGRWCTSLGWSTMAGCFLLCPGSPDASQTQ